VEGGKGSVAAARVVGNVIAQRAKDKGIEAVVSTATAASITARSKSSPMRPAKADWNFKQYGEFDRTHFGTLCQEFKLIRFAHYRKNRATEAGFEDRERRTQASFLHSHRCRRRCRTRRSWNGQIGQRAGFHCQGTQKARKSLIEVPLVNTTIPHMVIGRMGAARILLKPAAPGTGVIAGPATRAVVEAAGIKDILTKSLGSSNATNSVYAAIEGLKSLQKAPDVAKRRGKTINDLAIPAQLKDASLYEPRQPEPIAEYQADEKSDRFRKDTKRDGRGARSPQGGRNRRRRTPGIMQALVV
jgi:small subunit ribosomal protein S5